LRWVARRKEIILAKDIGGTFCSDFITFQAAYKWRGKYSQIGFKTFQREMKLAIKYGYFQNIGRSGTPGRPIWFYACKDSEDEWHPLIFTGSFVTATNSKGEKMEIPMTDKTGFDKPKLPDGIYPARLKEVRDTTPGEFGDRVVLVFEVLNNNTIVEMGMVCGKKISPKSKLGAAFTALGAKLSEGHLETASYIGKKCQVFVEEYKDKDGEKVCGINKVLKAAAE